MPWHPDIHAWAMAARRIGIKVARQPQMKQTWLQCQGTWFVGVDALPTDPTGAIDHHALPTVLKDTVGHRSDLHPAQLSITYPGYPRPRAGESDAAFRYRRNRDAAHMDGLLAEGLPKRRYLRERHDWILGLPLTEATPTASPLVVWEASHHILQSAMVNALQDVPETDWADTDITDVYTEARKTVFSNCKRVPLFTRPGEAVLLNPFLLHGVAPWTTNAQASKHGRMVAYFRPESSESGLIWMRQK
jgi:hypothetical protein